MPVMECTNSEGKSGHKCGAGGGCIVESKDGKSTWERACAQCTAQGKECSSQATSTIATLLQLAMKEAGDQGLSSLVEDIDRLVDHHIEMRCRCNEASRHDKDEDKELSERIDFLTSRIRFSRLTTKFRERHATNQGLSAA